MIVIPIILFYAILGYKVRDNFEKWKIDTPVNHSKEWKWYAIILSLTSGAFLIWLSDAPLVVSIPVSLLMIAFWFWFLFDGAYNLLRKGYAEDEGWKLAKGQYDFWYTGSNDKDDAVTDNFLQRLPLWAHILIKIGGIIILTASYIIL